VGRFLRKEVKDILFVTVGYTLGGSENMIARIAPILRDRGYKIRVLAFKGWGPVSEGLKKEGVECISLSGGGRFDIRILWRYFFYLWEYPPDIVIAFLYRAYVPTRIFCFLLGIPNISSVRDEGKWMNSIHIFLERLTAKLSLAIYSCSEAVTRFLLRDIGIKRERVVTIPNGIDVASYCVKINKKKKLKELGLSADLKVVGTICRLVEPKKGVEVLLEATQILQKKFDFQLLVVGSGKNELKLRLFAEKKGINVSFLGERTDVMEILHVMDVFVLASFYEGFPVVILEAMASRIPVVASRVGGLSEVVQDRETGFLVEPGNPNELAKKIKELLVNRKMRNNFGEAGFKRVKENFSIDKTVDGIESLWTDF
jgi:glycosyltransferase involved in cell wall biosynthesis